MILSFSIGVGVVVAVLVGIIWAQRRVLKSVKTELKEKEDRLAQMEKSVRANRKFELSTEEINALLAKEELENEKAVDEGGFADRVNYLFSVSNKDN